MSARADLVELLSQKTSILLDFDGPVCSIFSNRPAPGVAEALRGVLTRAGVAIVARLISEPDPLEVLRWTAELGRGDLLRDVESRLCAEEAEAAQVAEPTPYGRELIIGAFEASKPLAIVSNNSAGAINRYLVRQRLTRYGIPVSGRIFARPDLMKPNPEPILSAIKSLSTSPADSVLIGDSLADIDGAHAAGVTVIGYANRPEKVDQFANAGADLIVTSMAEVASAAVELRV
jgi:beta-phosphoglucomutase-like phosphatase (HAD superfamily)